MCRLVNLIDGKGLGRTTTHRRGKGIKSLFAGGKRVDREDARAVGLKKKDASRAGAMGERVHGNNKKRLDRADSLGRKGERKVLLSRFASILA